LPLADKKIDSEPLEIKSKENSTKIYHISIENVLESSSIVSSINLEHKYSQKLLKFGVKRKSKEVKN
jgi:hypothetical protein